MFLSITANKLSLKQTGRNSEVLLKQEAGDMRSPTKDAETRRREETIDCFSPSLPPQCEWQVKKDKCLLGHIPQCVTENYQSLSKEMAALVFD
jgi:hypothetical protein